MHVLFNNRSGSADVDAETLRHGLEAAGFDAVVDNEQEAGFARRLDMARRSPADVLIAAGGDGTVTALAEVAAQVGKPLAILPMGTANLLAKDLSLPLDPQAWMEALPSFVERRIGFVPAIAAGREHIRGHEAFAANIAFLGYAARRILRSRRIALEVTRDNEQPHIDRIQAVAISNNSYDEAFGHVFSRSRLDAGHLSIYKLHSVTLFKAIALAAGVVVGRWQDDDALTIETAEHVTIRSRRKQIKAMLDGEVETLHTPLNFRIDKQALRVLAPAVVESTVPGSEEVAA